MPSAYLNVALFEAIMSVNMSYTSPAFAAFSPTAFPSPTSQEKGLIYLQSILYKNKFAIKWFGEQRASVHMTRDKHSGEQAKYTI